MGETRGEKKPQNQYAAQAVSPIVNGEVKLIVDENALKAVGLFDVAEIAFVDMWAIWFEDHAITVRTDDGDYVFSRMGEWAQRFYDALCDSYNKAVLRAFFVKSAPAASASGDYRFTEEGVTLGGTKAAIRVYENCIALLPPNDDARRIPLCFAVGLEKSDFGFTLKLSTDETYVFSKMGLGTGHFVTVLEERIRALREKSIALVKEIDPTLNTANASQISKLMPEGVAAQMGQLASIAPSFTAALESKISQSRAAASYEAFKEVCDPAKIWVGFKRNDVQRDQKTVPAINEATGEETPPDPYLIWMAAPSPNRQYAAVEFAVQPGESAATFIYRTNGDFLGSTMKLNRALEAIDFKREVIRLSDDELRLKENADYYMAAKRTASLRYIRANFHKRVIHTESWKLSLTDRWSEEARAEALPQREMRRKRCVSCGIDLKKDTKFCNNCGTKV